MNTVGETYDQDFYAWAMKNAELIRQGRFGEIDAAHIAEELEAMGRRERRELVNRLAVLLAHLLKWQLQPQRRGKSWRATIKEQRYRIKERLAESPSLQPDLEQCLGTAYRYAILKVVKETPLEESELHQHCPFSLEQTLDEQFLPEKN